MNNAAQRRQTAARAGQRHETALDRMHRHHQPGRRHRRITRRAQRLFEPFYRSQDNPAGMEGASGLGLVEEAADGRCANDVLSM